MTSMAAHLQALGLARGAGWNEIQGRYRQLVLAHHPDLHPADSGAAERFREISASYSALAALHREQPEDPQLCLRRMCQDPRLRALDQDELGQRLMHSSSPWVRAAAACLLGEARHGCRREGPPPCGAAPRALLKAARRDPQLQVRLAAVQSLARVGLPGDLAGYLLDPDCRRGLSLKVLLRAAAAIWGRSLCSLPGRLAGTWGARG